MRENNLLVIDKRKSMGYCKTLAKGLAAGNFQYQILYDTRSLSDDMYLNSFDLVIINSVKGLTYFPKKKYKTIVLLGEGEKYKLPYLLKVDGIVSKENIKELEVAVNTVINGGYYISQAFKQEFVKQEELNESINRNIEYLPGILTKTELKVLEELICDKTNQEIANTLYLSKRTVEYHISSCMNKLNVRSRVGLAVKTTLSKALNNSL